MRPWEIRRLAPFDLDALVWDSLHRIAMAEGLSVEEVIFRARLREPLSQEDVDALHERLSALLSSKPA